MTIPQTPSTPSPEQWREEFEAWFRDKCHDRLDRNMPDKSYNDPTAHMMWQAYAAAKASTAAMGWQYARLDRIDLGPLKIEICDPPKAKAFLLHAGFITADGQLAEAFGDPAPHQAQGGSDV
jgi:hypothetical protein